MKRPFFSVTLIEKPTPCIIFHLISPLDHTALDCISFIIEENKKVDTVDPFPWDTAKIIILYQGIPKEDACFTVRLAGRRAYVENITPEYYGSQPVEIREYVDLGESIKEDLLAGKSIIQASIRAWRTALTSGWIKSNGLCTPDQFIKEAMDWKDMLTEWGYLKS